MTYGGRTGATIHSAKWNRLCDPRSRHASSNSSTNKLLFLEHAPRAPRGPFAAIVHTLTSQDAESWKCRLRNRSIAMNSARHGAEVAASMRSGFHGANRHRFDLELEGVGQANMKTVPFATTALTMSTRQAFSAPYFAEPRRPSRSSQSAQTDAAAERRCFIITTRFLFMMTVAFQELYGCSTTISSSRFASQSRSSDGAREEGDPHPSQLTRQDTTQQHFSSRMSMFECLRTTFLQSSRPGSPALAGASSAKLPRWQRWRGDSARACG